MTSGEMQLVSSHDLRLDAQEIQDLLSREGEPSANNVRDSARLLALTGLKWTGIRS